MTRHELIDTMSTKTSLSLHDALKVLDITSVKNPDEIGRELFYQGHSLGSHDAYEGWTLVHRLVA